MRPADINHSRWDNILEPANSGPWPFALRVGLRQIDGLKEAEMARLTTLRGPGYASPADLRARTRLPRATLEKLASADAFTSLRLSRREALWAIRAETIEAPAPLLALAGDGEDTGQTQLPDMPLSEHVVQDYQTLRLSLKSHPMALLRPLWDTERFAATQTACAAPTGRRVRTGGLVLVRQKPGTAKGVLFITIEDETGIANLIVWKKVAERFRPVVMGARILGVTGRVQTADNVTHIIAETLEDRSRDLLYLSEDAQREMLDGAMAPVDEVRRPVMARRGPPPKDSSHARHPRDVRVIPKSRDFH